MHDAIVPLLRKCTCEIVFRSVWSSELPCATRCNFTLHEAEEEVRCGLGGSFSGERFSFFRTR